MAFAMWFGRDPERRPYSHYVTVLAEPVEGIRMMCGKLWFTPEEIEAFCNMLSMPSVPYPGEIWIWRERDGWVRQEAV